MRRVVPLIMLVLLAVQLPASPACACTCAASTEAEHTRHATLIFEGGAVDSVEPDNDPVYSSTDPIVVTFTVTAVHKGEPGGARVTVQSPQGETSCGYRFAVGRRYKVYAQLVDGKLVTLSCSGNKDLGLDLTDAPVPPTPQAGGGTRDRDGGVSPFTVVGAGVVGLGIAALIAFGALLWTRRRRAG